MKSILLFILAVTSCFLAGAQINQGGTHANFGVDADTKSGYKKYGPNQNAPHSVDDWFKLSNIVGAGLLDTANASWHKTQSQTKNVSFVQRMSQPIFSKVNGKLWLDAVYIRDYTRTIGRDSTAFTGSDARNGVSPANWDGANVKVDADVDLVDAAAHFRRNGVAAQDSLWFFTSVSTMGTSNGRYVDVELFKKSVTYNAATKKFTTGGLNAGHTEWVFDPTGKVIQTGDIMISIVFPNGSNQKPMIDVHIWVSRLTHYFVNPSLFNFGSSIHTSGTWATHGYAHVVPNSSSTKIGAGIVNASSNSNSDSTYATPWGTIRSSGVWNQAYQSKQLVELAINFTKLGLDPASYPLTASQACNKMFQSIMFKSGTYEDGDGDDDGQRGAVAGKNGNDDDDDNNGNGHSCGDDNEDVTLHDFAGPVALMTPTVTFSLPTTDTITCSKPAVELKVSASSANTIYNWVTLDGEIEAASTDSMTVHTSKSGIYQVSGKLAQGCPSSLPATVVVVEDKTAPMPMADITMTPDGNIQLLGSDVSLLSTITGTLGLGPKLTWNWEGPNGFTSCEQSPVLSGEWIWGAYYLTATNQRNGCSGMGTLDIAFRGSSQIIVQPKGKEPKIIVKDGIWANASNQLQLNYNSAEEKKAVVRLYNSNGQLAGVQALGFQKGANTVSLPFTRANQVRVVTVSVNGKTVLTRKILF